MSDEYKCPNCGRKLELSLFKTYAYKRAGETQWRCIRGCGRCYILQSGRVVLDPAWCDHDYLLKTLFREGIPNHVYTGNYYRKYFDYMSASNFARSVKRAQKKWSELQASRVKAVKEDNPTQHKLFE